jgi:hypothetical protein
MEELLLEILEEELWTGELLEETFIELRPSQRFWDRAWWSGMFW